MIAAGAVASAGGTDWLPAVIGVISALLTGGGVAAFFRARPEGSKILVDAAQGAVVVQTGVITDLRRQLDEQDEHLKEARAQIAELQAHIAEVTELRAKVRTLEHENEMLRSDNARLSARVQELERKTL